MHRYVLGKVDMRSSERENRMTQKKYSKEFKREALRLMVVDGLSGVFEGANSGDRLNVSKITDPSPSGARGDQ